MSHFTFNLSIRMNHEHPNSRKSKESFKIHLTRFNLHLGASVTQFNNGVIMVRIMARKIPGDVNLRTILRNKDRRFVWESRPSRSREFFVRFEMTCDNKEEGWPLTAPDTRNWVSLNWKFWPPPCILVDPVANAEQWTRNDYVDDFYNIRVKHQLFGYIVKDDTMTGWTRTYPSEINNPGYNVRARDLGV